MTDKVNPGPEDDPRRCRGDRLGPARIGRGKRQTVLYQVEHLRAVVVVLSRLSKQYNTVHTMNAADAAIVRKGLGGSPR